MPSPPSALGNNTQWPRLHLSSSRRRRDNNNNNNGTHDRYVHRPLLVERLASYGSSVAADDELTPSAPCSLVDFEMDSRASDDGDSEAGHGQRRPAYPGEDTRSTSDRELWGFYAYGWAAEVFVVDGVGSFVPIMLEQLASERGFLQSDHTKRCHSDLDTSPPVTSSLHNLFARKPPSNDHDQCVVYILGHPVNTASFAMYTFSISVLIQAIVIISMSGAADHGRYRKTLLLTFAYVGAVATMLFLGVTSATYMIGALLAIVANTCFGASFVLLNSFLPLLVRHYPGIRDTAKQSSDRGEGESEGLLAANDEEADEADDAALANSTSALLPRPSIENANGKGNGAAVPYSDRHGSLRSRGDTNNTSNSDTTPTTSKSSQDSPALQLSTRISSNGIGIGYISAILVQILSVLVIRLTGGTTFSLRLVLFLIGAWWFVFTIPCMYLLRARPGPPLSHAGFDGTNPAKQSQSRLRACAAYLVHAWISLYRTTKLARRLRDMLTFLLAWFLLSDAIATVSGTAVLFAKTSLGMRPAALALINVVVMLFGVLGAFSWRRVSSALNIPPLYTIVTCTAIFELIPLYALAGYLPFADTLTRPLEIYGLAALYGLVLGGVSSYCRATFAELIPPGNEAAFYALYAITDKGSSIFGPAIVGAITDATGDIRRGFTFLAFLVAAPAFILLAVDIRRGAREARVVAVELGGVDAAAADAETGD